MASDLSLCVAARSVFVKWRPPHLCISSEADLVHTISRSQEDVSVVIALTESAIRRSAGNIGGHFAKVAVDIVGGPPGFADCVDLALRKEDVSAELVGKALLHGCLLKSRKADPPHRRAMVLAPSWPNPIPEAVTTSHPGVELTSEGVRHQLDGTLRCIYKKSILVADVDEKATILRIIRFMKGNDKPWRELDVGLRRGLQQAWSCVGLILGIVDHVYRFPLLPVELENPNPASSCALTGKAAGNDGHSGDNRRCGDVS